MDKAVEQSADFYHLIAWAHANRQRLIVISSVIVAIGAAIGIYIWHKNFKETEANNALSNIKLPANAREAQSNPVDAQSYLSVANDFSGTSAGSRALLMAGQTYFDEGKFDKAQAQFGRFLGDYPDSPLANQASLGIAASLEAQGKINEAASRYSDYINRHQGDSTIPQAKSALARLDVALNRPEDAARIYAELAKAGNNDTWSAEAGIQLEELLAKHPDLKKLLAPPPAPTPAPSQTITIPPVPAPTNSTSSSTNKTK